MKKILLLVLLLYTNAAYTATCITGYNNSRNLFDEQYPNVSTTMLHKSIYVGPGTYTCSFDQPANPNDASMVYFLAGNVTYGESNALGNGVFLNHPVTVTTTDGYVTIAYRKGYYVYDNVEDKIPSDYHCQIEAGETATAYNPMENCNMCPDLNTIIGNVAATSEASKSNDGTPRDYTSTYGITENGTFAVAYGNAGVVKGRSQCSTQNGTEAWSSRGATISTNLPDNTGQNCYCQLDSYTSNNGKTIQLSCPWVFNLNLEGRSDCMDTCASDCAWRMATGPGAYSYNLALRYALFNNASCPIGIASTSYVQGMYEAINNSKMAKLNPNSIEFTADSSPYGFFTAIEGAGDKFRFKREEITLPFGSYDNPTGRMSIWLE